MIEHTEITLDFDQLEKGELGLVWGLTSSVSKDGDGNPLLAQLAAAFGEEYALRTGKLSLLPNTPNTTLNLILNSIPSMILKKHSSTSPLYRRHLRRMINDHRQSFAAQF